MQSSIAPRRATARVIRLTVLASLSATSASAQRTGASVDIGGLNMRYADSVNANAVAFTPAFWTESSLSSFRLSSTISRFTSGAWSAQGDADASVFTRRQGLLLGEIEGTAGGSTHEDGSRTGQLLASARAHVAASDRGAWIGGGLGRTWDGSIWSSVRQGEAAAWTRIGDLTAFASATPVAVNDSIRYTDAQLSAGLNLARIEVTASAGFRSGNNLPTLGGNEKSWGSASITGWVGSRLAIVASAGTYPVDFTQGFPGGRFASLSLRLGQRRFLPATTSISELGDLNSASEASRSSSRHPVFEARDLGSGSRELRVRAPSAATVEIMGDFTDWRSVSLQNSGAGWWSVALPIVAGIHELNLRIDGGKWTVPPGLPQRSDEFGTTVGILVIR